ncbi:MAG: DUF4097 family beta strand repeat-containing protein [Acidobacteriota bacterium]|nr:DUF4097 family beta strand repeat-containing protein [Acidobacteriota bacterium]
MNKKLWIQFVCAVVVTCAFGLTAVAQEKSLSCDDNWRNGDRVGHCVMKEQTIAATGSLSVDGKKNGGISVKGWERREVLVRSKIQSWGNTKADAVTVAEQILIVTGNSNVYAEGPTNGGDQWWSVSYEIFVPRNSNLSLKAHNGGISISSVRGQIEFSTTNGGVALKGLAGNVKGTTKNGGLNVDLDGNRWDGEGLDVTTTNGGVNLRVPENYSAHLETGTVNGGLKTEIPITVQGEIKRNLSVDLGSGGSPVKVRTTNGGVSIKRQSLK